MLLILTPKQFILSATLWLAPLVFGLNNRIYMLVFPTLNNKKAHTTNFKFEWGIKVLMPVHKSRTKFQGSTIVKRFRNIIPQATNMEDRGVLQQGPLLFKHFKYIQL